MTVYLHSQFGVSGDLSDVIRSSTHSLTGVMMMADVTCQSTDHLSVLLYTESSQN